MTNVSRLPTVGRPVSTEFQSKRELRLRHDLRQSLGAVMALVSIIESNPLVVPEVLERLDQIQCEADWMAKILSTPDTDPQEVRVVDIGEAVSESWALVAACAPCLVRLVREPAVHALADPVALRRSTRNLIENAVRAVGAHGTVEVRVLARGDDVMIEVADDGPGFGKIPAQQGLGLVTVRRFVTQFGGSFVVGRSELGGALVRLGLPAMAMDQNDVEGDLA